MYWPALNASWNSAFRRIFNFRKHDSVRQFMCGLGRLDFHHVRAKLILTFVKSAFCS